MEAPDSAAPAKDYPKGKGHPATGHMGGGAGSKVGLRAGFLGSPNDPAIGAGPEYQGVMVDKTYAK